MTVTPQQQSLTASRYDLLSINQNNKTVCITITGVTGHRTCFRVRLSQPWELSSSGMWRCSLGEQFSVFRRVLVPSSSGCHSSEAWSIQTLFGPEHRGISFTRNKAKQSPYHRYNTTEDLNSKQHRCDWLTDWLVDLLTGWLTGWLADWLTEWLADWLLQVPKLTGYYFVCSSRHLHEPRPMNWQGLRRNRKWFNISTISELAASGWENRESLSQEAWRSYNSSAVTSRDSQHCTNFLCKCFCWQVIEVQLCF